MVRDQFASPYKQVADGLQAVPAVLTALAPLAQFNVWIEQIVVSNPTAAAVTLTVQDAAANKLIPAVSLAAASNTVFSFPRPVKFVGGASWLGSAAGLIAEVKAFYV
jgi:hypothetical protein